MSINNNINNKKTINICMASDFFYPSFGGVEIQIYQISLMLVRKGYKVIIITHKYKDRVGERFMGNGIKVIYLPFDPLFKNVICPNFSFSTLPYVRKILIEEEINLIHIHQCTSILTHDILLVATLLQIPSVFHDHSLFSIGLLEGVNISKVTKCLFKNVDQFISVSYTSRDNLSFRINEKERITVIPNSIDYNSFKPVEMISLNKELLQQDQMIDINHIPFNMNSIMSIDLFDKNNIIYNTNNTEFTLVIISRQTYRKGIDLLIEVIPILYKIFPHMKILIGGDGPKHYLLKQMIEVFSMNDRISLLGSLTHRQVKETMQKGDIFLNTSLTESFCIAILEACCTGLFVITTNIGGVDEVLPSYMRILVEVDSKQIIKAVIHSVNNIDIIKRQSWMFYYHLKNSYVWSRSIERIEEVYDKALKSDKSFLNMIHSNMKHGFISSLYQVFLMIVLLIYLLLVSLVYPKGCIKKKKNFSRELYLKYLHEKKVEKRMV